MIVLDGSDRILLGIRAKDPNRGKWVLPGGKVRPYETLEDAARREIREETGLEVEIDGIATIRELVTPGIEHRLIVYSNAHVVGGELTGASDLEAPAFFRPEELTTLDLSDVVRNVLDELGFLCTLVA